jgi:hypothetical protein
LRSQLDSQFDEYKGLLLAGTVTKKGRHGLHVGDLESDNEEQVARDEFSKKLRESTDRMSKMSG